MANNNINITVLIAGRPYSLSVNAEEEALVKKAVSEINDKISQYQMTYRQKDKQDFLSMILLTTAVELEKQKSIDINESSVERLDQINSIIEKALVG